MSWVKSPRAWILGVLGLLIVISWLLLPPAKRSIGGPLGAWESEASWCLQVGANTDGSRTIGYYTLNNDSPSDVLVQQVRLVEPDGIVLIDALVVPVRSRSESIGMRAPFPPNLDELGPEIQWSDRVPAVGAIVPPYVEGMLWNLVLGVRLEDSKQLGRIRGIEVDYRVGRHRFTYLVPHPITLTQWDCADNDRSG